LGRRKEFHHWLLQVAAWAILLSAYTYDIEHKSTNRNANADGLSQLPLQESDCTSSVPASFNIGQIQALPVTSDSIRTATGQDPILSRVLLYTRKGWPGRVPDVLKPYHIRKQELTVEDGCILWGIRVLIPRCLQEDILTELHQGHPGVSRMKTLSRSHVWWG